MEINISPITQKEFDLIRPAFEINAEALAKQSLFIEENGQIIKSPAKSWFWAGYDQSKFIKAIIDDNSYIIGSGNIITGIVTDVLPEACQKYAECFGTRNAHDVIKAIYQMRPIEGYDDMTKFESLLSSEQFAMVFKLESDGSVNHSVLRLDLFRIIKEEKDNPGKFEFIGGLMHLYKHFKYKGFNLSTKKGENELSHPTDVMGMVIKSFFEVNPIYKEDKKGFVTHLPWPPNKTIVCSFYPEEKIGVNFLNSMYLT